MLQASFLTPAAVPNMSGPFSQAAAPSANESTWLGVAPPVPAFARANQLPLSSARKG